MRASPGCRARRATPCGRASGGRASGSIRRRGSSGFSWRSRPPTASIRGCSTRTSSTARWYGDAAPAPQTARIAPDAPCGGGERDRPRHVGCLTRLTPYRYGRGMSAIALGADHAGFPLKEDLKVWLIERGHEVVDCGTQSSESVDYPDYAAAVAGAVVAGKADRGVLVCGTGLGMAIAANKLPGIRAAACTDAYTARLSREHNDANVLANKYAEGYPGRRYYGGCEVVDVVEDLAIARAKELFGAQHANVQPHSGAQANMAVYFTVLKPGDTVLGPNLSHGGHLTAGSPVNYSGKFYTVVPYGVRRDTERIDLDQVRDLAKQHRPKMIIAGGSAFPRAIDFQPFADVAREVGAVLMADIAHPAGLVAAGLHPSPVGLADFVTTTTHKTLRGPRGGMVMCGTPHAQALDKTVMPGVQGGPLMHVIAAKAVAFKEALTPEWRRYQGQVIQNARALAEALMARGYRLVSGGTDTHLMLLDLSGRNITGKDAQEALDRAWITVNKNTVPFETKSPMVTSGVRIGTPAVTTRGMREAEMAEIARLIDQVLANLGSSSVEAKVRGEVQELTNRFPLYPERTR